MGSCLRIPQNLPKPTPPRAQINQVWSINISLNFLTGFFFILLRSCFGDRFSFLSVVGFNVDYKQRLRKSTLHARHSFWELLGYRNFHHPPIITWKYICNLQDSMRNGLVCFTSNQMLVWTEGGLDSLANKPLSASQITRYHRRQSPTKKPWFKYPSTACPKEFIDPHLSTLGKSFSLWVERWGEYSKLWGVRFIYGRSPATSPSCAILRSGLSFRRS